METQTNKKKYIVTFLIEDIVQNIDADSKEQAEQIAEEMLNNDETEELKNCYKIEVEEVEE